MRLVVVSNRLPVVIEEDEEAWSMRPSSGGLVTALTPILQRHRGRWIGWSGATDVAQSERLDAALRKYGAEVGFDLQAVPMSQAEVEGFYRGFSNEIVWPLFHDLQSRCNFVPDYWTTYLQVNDKFAEIVAEQAQPDDFIWVQDYHLMSLARKLRRRGLNNRLSFFLHIPFPPPDIFAKLPWRGDVLEGLLAYDVLGFQTPRDRDNFTDCVRKLLPGARLRRCLGGKRATYDGRTCTVATFPIGIDYHEFAQASKDPAVGAQAASVRTEMPGAHLVLGVDRLDYTKGIPDRLRAFGRALERFPELHRQATLLQVVVPSRGAVPEYQDLQAEIERLVTQINGQFTEPGWVPIQHVFRSLTRAELLAYYCAADVALITSLKDGMNLVAKEFCACQHDGDGVLILSEFAGAAVQLLRGALLVNPYDLDGVAEALRQAVTMPLAQRRPRMRRLQRIIRRQDVHWWADRVLQACGVADPEQTLPSAEGAAPIVLSEAALATADVPLIAPACNTETQEPVAWTT